MSTMSNETTPIPIAEVSKVHEIYDRCIAFVDGEIISEQSAGLHKPEPAGNFRGFKFIRPAETNPVHEVDTDKNSATHTTKEEREEFRKTPIELNMRKIERASFETEPTIAIAIPEVVNFFMILDSSRATVIGLSSGEANESVLDSSGESNTMSYKSTREANDQDLQKLEQYLNAVEERKRDRLASGNDTTISSEEFDNFSLGEGEKASPQK